MAMVRDAFTWVDSGAIAYPALHQKILELTMPMLTIKKLFPEFPLVQGRTATFVKESGSRSAGITAISEASEILMDFTPLSYVTVTPYKKGLRVRVPREDIEDFYIPVVEQQLRRLARRMAYTIEADCMAVIAGSAGYSMAATGKTIGATGTEFQISSGSAYGLGQEDIVYAKNYIASKSFTPTNLLINPVNARSIEVLPNFTLWSQYGQPIVQQGAIGQIYNLEVDITPIVSAGTAYVLSNGLNPSGAYAPMGFFIIKRPLMTDLDMKKEFDAIDVSLTTRYAPVILNGDAIVQITGLMTS